MKKKEKIENFPLATQLCKSIEKITGVASLSLSLVAACQNSHLRSRHSDKNVEETLVACFWREIKVARHLFTFSSFFIQITQ